MRCRCCNSLDAVWDGVDYYCEECLDEIHQAIKDFETEEIIEDFVDYSEE